MILTPIKNDKFNKTDSYEDKAIIVFGKNVGIPIGIAYEEYLKNRNTPKYRLKDFVLYKFSQCKELYDKFLVNCTFFQDKEIKEQARVYLNFLEEKIPDEWLQNDCKYNSIDDIEDEEVTIEGNTYNFNDIDIYTQNFTIQAIHKKHTYEEIDLNPEFQRKEVWKLKQKSLLIESLLINIPIPAFYIDARTANKWNVIDGLQRLSTIMNFVNDEFSLTETEYLQLQGKKFSTLERKYQRRIEDYELAFNLVKPSTPEEIAFNIFTRINTLGTPLSAQEIRHAMNLGTATQFLDKLSNTDEFITAISKKNKDSLSQRMNDKALILRYLTFKLLGYKKVNDKDEKGYYKNDMNAFLIKGMKELNKYDISINEDYIYLENLEIAFKDSMKKAYIIFEDNSFRKYFTKNDKKKAPINIPLFETISYSIEKYSFEEIEEYKKQIFNAFLELFNEKDSEDNEEEGKFLDWITTATNNGGNVLKRFEKVNKLFADIIGY
jgi:hypothetical protein